VRVKRCMSVTARVEGARGLWGWGEMIGGRRSRAVVVWRGK